MTQDETPGEVFAVVGWSDFQHYKDRDPIWIKLHRSLLDSYKWACLPDASRALLVGIWLLAARHDNRIPADPEWLRRRLHTEGPVDLQILVDKDFIRMLSTGQQSAMLEREIEIEKEIEKEIETTSVANATTAPVKKLKRAGKAQQTPDEAEFLEWVWNRWLEVMGYQERRLTLGTARAKVALARYREGRTREEFEAILVWASTDPWLRGTDPKSTKPYDDFDTLFRPSNFDKYLKRAGDTKRSNPRNDQRLGPSDRPINIEVL